MIILLLTLLAIMPAHAKTKTASTRVAETFTAMMPPQHPSGKARRAAFAAPPRYIANRPSFFAAGKLIIYRECEVDLLQDPGEHTCRPVWAWI